MIRLIVFFVVSMGLTYVSWASLHAPRSHGFPRFFAWETLLALVLLNGGTWFQYSSRLKLFATAVLFASIAYAVEGVRLLWIVGRPAPSAKSDSPRFGFEKTTVLVTVGLYKHVRHPLYGSLLFLGWGTFLKHPTWTCAALAAAASVFLILTAKAEEAENLRDFGPSYADYMRRTRRFIPFLI